MNYAESLCLEFRVQSREYNCFFKEGSNERVSHPWLLTEASTRPCAYILGQQVWQMVEILLLKTALMDDFLG